MASGSLLQLANWKINIVHRESSSISMACGVNKAATSIDTLSAKVQKIDALKNQAQNEQNQRKCLELIVHAHPLHPGIVATWHTNGSPKWLVEFAKSVHSALCLMWVFGNVICNTLIFEWLESHKNAFLNGGWFIIIFYCYTNITIK